MSRRPMKNPLIHALFNAAAEQGVTNTELAARAGYDRKTLTDIKYQHHTSRVSTLQDIGAALGLELVWRPKRAPIVDRVDRYDGQQSTNGAL